MSEDLGLGLTRWWDDKADADKVRGRHGESSVSIHLNLVIKSRIFDLKQVLRWTPFPMHPSHFMQLVQSQWLCLLASVALNPTIMRIRWFSHRARSPRYGSESRRPRNVGLVSDSINSIEPRCICVHLTVRPHKHATHSLLSR